MKTTNFRYLVLVLVTIVAACSKNDPCEADYVPENVFFTVVDKATGLSIIGKNKAFNPDTIAKLNELDYPYIRFDSGIDSVLTLNYNGIASQQSLPFRLSNTDMDTIGIVYTMLEWECGVYKDLLFFHYNRDTTSIQNRFAIGAKR
ncbi:MAG: hypothetical protein EP332_05670 [Bacteroidetes bacterium]|nr:MAG: hypothetical protein EP332_05670 [Bacteroidota bacterium]